MTRPTAKNAIRSSGLLLALGLVLLLAGVARGADAPKSEDCLACHADRDLKREGPGGGGPAGCRAGGGAARGEGVHGSRPAAARGVGCASCHGTHAVRPA